MDSGDGYKMVSLLAEYMSALGDDAKGLEAVFSDVLEKRSPAILFDECWAQLAMLFVHRDNVGKPGGFSRSLPAVLGHLMSLAYAFERVERDETNEEIEEDSE
jgi:hypothetical protein